MIFILVTEEEKKTKSKQKKGKKDTYFDPDWLTNDDFKDWVVRVKDDDTKYRCRVCRKSNKLSNKGIGALKDHMEGGTHLENLKKIKKFFPECSSSSSCSTPAVPANKQAQIDDIVTNSGIAKAEIRWILEVCRLWLLE